MTHTFQLKLKSSGCMSFALTSNTVRLKKDAIHRRLYNNQSFVETAIYRVFVMIYRVFVI